MIEKKNYQHKLSAMKDIFNKYDFLAQNRQQCSQLEQDIDDFAFRVVLIGGFSSGKSAFLNRLIGRQLFKEELGPETAMPSEVCWAPLEECEAINKDGTRQKLPLETATANPPHNVQYLSFHLDNEFLKQRPELILVDFPGYDSNLTAHNEAINAYLKKGSAFLLFIPAPSGALTSSDIKFLKEATHYPQALGCLISKSDVRPPEKCQEIAEYVGNGVRLHYGAQIPVTTVSIMPDCVPDFEERVAAMIDRFEPQTLFDISLAPAINAELNTAINALEEYASANTLVSSDLDIRIAANRDAVENLARQLEKERVGLDRKYQYEIIPSIMSRLENAFNANIDALTEAAMAGENRFGDVAQSIVRPILAGVPGEIQANLRDVISKMPIATQPDAPEDNNIRDTLLNIVEVVSTLIPTTTGGKVPKPGAPGGPMPTSPFAGLGTGILVGALGNPILGAVIAIAPALINFFFGGKKQQQGPDPAQVARSQVVSQGIPQAMARLESAITPEVMKTRDAMFREIELRIRESQEAALQAIELVKKEKETRQMDHAALQSQIQTDIDSLRALAI